ncbi:MAG: hypothetical protein U9R21_01150 [Candidatus Thermoplasmatota archaeon]|nr:hypothetical protein [Candidatus Thermoplasmatota archaeon]
MAKTEIVQVNYWREIRKDINKVVGDIHGLVLLTHNSIEFIDIVDFLNKIRKDERLTVLYISLVNSYSNIKNALKAKPLDSKELFVVDCVSGFLIEIQDSVGCVYRKPPSNLEEMKDLIMKNIRMINPNIIVMDSLTQFINFTTPKDRELHEFYKFLKSMKEDAMGLINDTVILLYDDKMGSMKKLPILFADYILKLEIIREEIEWKD